MASFPETRLRRLRRTESIRAMVRETSLDARDLILPLFVAEGTGLRQEIESMPGVCRYSSDLLPDVVRAAWARGIPSVILFGIPAKKDEVGSQAYSETGVVQQAVAVIKQAVPDMVVITDVCLCEYTSHGHCGVLDRGGVVDNDRTLDLLAGMAVSHARAGADIVAPSDMMDGRVGAIRQALDAGGFQQVPILSYAVKYASAFYGPFREAVCSVPQFGDRCSYQMDPANWREALREVEQDLAEGADMVMVKPALAYMDVIQRVRAAVNCPVVAFNVSGEYAMVKAAAGQGWVDEKKIVLETMTGLKRAGADMIISYHAMEVASWLRSESNDDE